MTSDLEYFNILEKLDKCGCVTKIFLESLYFEKAAFRK